MIHAVRPGTMSDKEHRSDGDTTRVTETARPERVYFTIGKGVGLEEAADFIDALYRKHFGADSPLLRSLVQI
jgi:hypothetical protein